jgi:hypothetical protein
MTMSLVVTDSEDYLLHEICLLVSSLVNIAVPLYIIQTQKNNSTITTSLTTIICITIMSDIFELMLSVLVKFVLVHHSTSTNTVHDLLTCLSLTNTGLLRYFFKFKGNETRYINDYRGIQGFDRTPNARFNKVWYILFAMFSLTIRCQSVLMLTCNFPKVGQNAMFGRSY